MISPVLIMLPLAKITRHVVKLLMVHIDAVPYPMLLAARIMNIVALMVLFARKQVSSG